MKTNIELTRIIEDADVQVRFASDSRGVIEFIDLVLCDDYEEIVVKRFMPIDDGDLQDMLDDEEEFDPYDDDDEEEECDCAVCRLTRMMGME